eukprot:213435-Pyramimonas_sp.AAC.1
MPTRREVVGAACFTYRSGAGEHATCCCCTTRKSTACPTRHSAEYGMPAGAAARDLDMEGRGLAQGPCSGAKG